MDVTLALVRDIPTTCAGPEENVMTSASALDCWDTREAPPDGFLDRWIGDLSRAAHPHFGFDPDYLRWSALHARPGVALRIDGDVPLVCVAERRGASLVCGTPWRWSVARVDTGGDPVRFEPAPDPTAADARRVAVAIARVAPRDRIEMHLPSGAAPNGFRSGTTCLNPLTSDDDVIYGALDDAKRRAIRKAQRAGYRVVEATTSAQRRAFAGLQRQTEFRRGRSLPPTPESPAPGEAWREWELPWMWLLVAERDGRVEAGSGFGRFPRGSVDYRTNASSDAGRRDGANVLLAWEAMRRAGEAGHTRLNWCGATRFKREMGGEVVPIACELGGGLRWMVPNSVTTSFHRARPLVAGWAKALGMRRDVRRAAASTPS